MRALKNFALLMTILALITAPVSLFLSSDIYAATLANRSIRLDSTLINVITSHNFRFDTVTADIIGSIEFEYCSNSPLVEEPCIAPSGLDVTSATIASQSGITGFSIHPNTTANNLILTRAAILAPSQTAAYRFSGIVNPDSAGSQYLRVRTFNSEDATTGEVDSAGLAYSMVEGFGISVYVPPFLLFCTAITIPNQNCAQASGHDINFGQFSWYATSYSTSQMLAVTNAEYGYNITVTGTTMTAGVHTIKALTVPSFSDTGKSQFGLNLRDNSVPDVGANPTGPRTANPTIGYNQSNLFMFEDNDALVSVGTVNDKRTFTVSYIVNIHPAEKPGVYSTTLSYTALANF